MLLHALWSAAFMGARTHGRKLLGKVDVVGDLGNVARSGGVALPVARQRLLGGSQAHHCCLRAQRQKEALGDS
jgi:hypothetical protein